MPKQYIEIKSNFVGFHRFPLASKMSPKIAFLEQTHRHVFYVEFMVEVQHSDRELEFFLIQEKLKYTLKTLEGEMSVDKNAILSCENIAHTIRKKMLFQYKELENRYMLIKVSEDNENAAVVQWDINE